MKKQVYSTPISGIERMELAPLMNPGSVIIIENGGNASDMPGGGPVLF